jgi:uncharacterized protein (TIGR03437 family)
VFGQYLATGNSSAAALPLPNAWSTTQMTIAGRPMPLLFAGPNQVNAMVPYDLPINATHQVVVQRGNTLSIPEPVSMLSSQSGVFTKDLTGTPVTANDAIVVYCDGMGNVNPQAIGGSETPVTPLSQTIDAVTITIGRQTCSSRG